MIRVFVADSSAVVRSVLKEIIFKTKKLEWIGEAASFSELNPIRIISQKGGYFNAFRILISVS